MAKMKAIRIHDFGAPEVLKLEQLERPVPAAGEVLVRVLAASVNPVDWKIRSGNYGAIGEDDLPIIPGRDICGEIVAVGEDVGHFSPGDRVFAFLDMARGGYAEYVAVPAEELAAVPQSLSAEEAAAVPLAGITAWQGLFDHGGLEEGQRVLVHGGGGGVGHLAVQIAKAKGAWVATTVSPEDVVFARKLGADRVIDYKSELFEGILDPVDMVFDLVGGETRARSFQVLKEGGILVSTLGEPDGETASKFNIRTAGYMARPNAAQLAEIADLIERRKLRVCVQQTLQLSEAAKAHEVLENQHTQGKVVLSIA
ncbi:NADP-dependent oxidoreductase [Martelella sp. AMO21009]